MKGLFAIAGFNAPVCGDLTPRLYIFDSAKAFRDAPDHPRLIIDLDAKDVVELTAYGRVKLHDFNT